MYQTALQNRKLLKTCWKYATEELEMMGLGYIKVTDEMEFLGLINKFIPDDQRDNLIKESRFGPRLCALLYC